MTVYYIHLHGNYGMLCLLLPGNTEWTGFDIEYCQDHRPPGAKSTVTIGSVDDLPF